MASDLVRLICPNLRCRAILTAPIAARGKTVRCRECGMKVKIPMVLADPGKTAGATASDAADASEAGK